MHLLTPDEAHLLVVDTFGLTRLSFPNKLKTDKKLMASDIGALSCDTASTAIALWRDGWVSTHALSLPALAKLASYGRFEARGAVMAPEGQSLVVLDQGALQRVPLAKKKRTSTPLPKSAPADAPTISLGDGDVVSLFYDYRLAFAPDGHFALLVQQNEGRVLWLGTMTDDGFTFDRAWKVTLRSGGLVALFPESDGVVLALHDLRAGRACFARVARTGAVSHFTLPALSMPARRGSHWVSQVAPDRVVELDETGAEITAWPLTDATLHGHGEVAASPSRVVYIAPDRGRFVDLLRGVTLDRKLSTDDAPIRDFFVGLAEKHNRMGRRYGREILYSEIKTYGTALSPNFTITPSVGTLGATLASSMFASALLTNHFRHGALSANGYSAHGLAEHVERRADLADVRAVVEAVDEAGLWFGDAARVLGEMALRLRSSTSRYGGEIEWPPATPDASRVLLRAVLAHLGTTAPHPTLAPNVERWASSPVTFEEVKRELKRLSPRPSGDRHVLDAIAEIALTAMEPEPFADLLTWCLLDAPFDLLWNAQSALLGLVSWLSSQRPDIATLLRPRVIAHAPTAYQSIGDMRSQVMMAGNWSDD